MARRYMTLARFKELTVMPGPDVDAIETLESGWTQKQLDRVGSAIEVRLAKRYAVPFGVDPVVPGNEQTDVPQVIEDWMVAIMTPRAYAKRGFNPSSGDLWFTETILAPAQQAMADVKEAADSNLGLFDLPLKEADAPAGAASRGGPKAYTEASPYVWTDVQQRDGTGQDGSGSGTVW